MICKECAIEINGATINSERKKFYYHLSSCHNMTHEDYIIKHNYNGTRPLCNCGCNTPVRFEKSIFFKYFKDHKNKMPPSKESIEKTKRTKSINNTLSLSNRLSRLDITEHDLINYYNDFIKFNISLRGISNKTWWLFKKKHYICKLKCFRYEKY